MTVFAAVALPVAHLGYFHFSAQINNGRYQAQEQEQARSVKFQLYEPTYVIPNYELVENEIDFSGNLVFTYFNRSTQQSHDTVAGELYTIDVQPVSKIPRVGVRLQNKDMKALQTVNGTMIAISGTISRSEADKVLSSMQKISYSNIKFRSDWASTR